MFFEKKYGIDLGSGSIKIYSHSRDRTITDYNMVAYRDHTIIASGAEAYEMFERTPSDVHIVTPMVGGFISDLELEEIILYKMMRDKDRFPARGSHVYFSAPSDISTLDKRTYWKVVNGNWIHRCHVFLVESPIADACALRLNIDESPGTMLVNIGEQTTRFSILANGKIIMNRVLPIGGRQINEEIAQEIRHRYNLVVGQHTANRLKLTMGRLMDQQKEARKAVGLDAVSGLPKEEVVSAFVVNTGIMNSITLLASQMKAFFERIPPQVAYTVSREGIYLTGGTARIPFIDKYLASCTGYTFNLSQAYENTTVHGLERIMHSKTLAKYAQPIRARRL